MKLPIQVAFTYPKHLLSDWEELDLARIGELTFEEKDIEKFLKQSGLQLLYYLFF